MDDFDQVAAGALDEPEEPEELESTELGAEEPEGGGEEPPSRPEETGAEERAAPPAADDEAWRSHLRQGETPEQAISRLAGEASQQHGRAASHWNELKELRESVRSMEPKLSAAERIFAAMQKRQEAEERAALEKELPDPELEPERYHQMQLRAINERLIAQETRREREARENLTREEYERRQERTQAVDDYQARELLTALGQVEGVEADPEVSAAFEMVSELQKRDLLDRYGEADFYAPSDNPQFQTKGEEAMTLIRLMWGREAAARGASIRDEYVRRARHLSEVTGGAAPAARTNGHQKPAAGRRGPTARDIEAQAAKAGRGAGVRRNSGGGSVAAPKTFEDFAALPEAEQAKILEAGKMDESELWAGLSDPDWG